MTIRCIAKAIDDNELEWSRSHPSTVKEPVRL